MALGVAIATSSRVRVPELWQKAGWENRFDGKLGCPQKAIFKPEMPIVPRLLALFWIGFGLHSGSVLLNHVG